MPQLKIALIGAGSFVFGPSVLHDALIEHRLSGVELALIDVNREVVDLMAGVGRRMARDQRLNVTVSAHTDRPAGLDGADFVVCSAAVDMRRRFAMDKQIAHRHDPSHHVSEFGGVAGISYSLRQIALIEQICQDMKRHCPNAWLLDSANPLPRVCQAAHELGVKTAGFCSASLVGFARAWKILHGQEIRYPFEPARSTYELTAAGVNHFTWMIDLRDRTSGQSLLPEINRRLCGGASTGGRVSDRLHRETGYVPTINDEHFLDFLPPQPGEGSIEESSHGTDEDRKKRLRLLAEIGAGTQPWQPLVAKPSWEKPIDFVAALALGRPASFYSLNLINAGQIPQLPRNVFVETPATAGPDGPAPAKVDLPETVVPYCTHAAQVTDTIVRAARQRSRKLLREAVELDPTIVDKPSGWAAIEECLQAHADLLPSYK